MCERKGRHTHTHTARERERERERVRDGGEGINYTPVHGKALKKDEDKIYFM